MKGKKKINKQQGKGKTNAQFLIGILFTENQGHFNLLFPFLYIYTYFLLFDLIKKKKTNTILDKNFSFSFATK